MRVFNLFLLLYFASYAMADDIVGFWQTEDKKKHESGSVVAVYSYQGKYYGKIVAIYDEQGAIVDTIYEPVRKATSLVGDPYFCGLDIVFEASPEENGTYHGHVMDPRNGKVYRAELWRRGNDLVLRGKFFLFGRNAVWPPFADKDFTPSFKKPDLSTLVPDKAVAKD